MYCLIIIFCHILMIVLECLENSPWKGKTAEMFKLKSKYTRLPTPTWTLGLLSLTHTHTHTHTLTHTHKHIEQVTNKWSTTTADLVTL